MAAGGSEAASAGALEAVRIYVGGLGESVTAADIEKTFSPHGRLASVDLVRTKGRSLAFMDFEPASDRSLAKIFSVYNGCTWKGGKLKLEKAKEHYLTRLKREWEADTKLVHMTPTDPIAEKDAGRVKKMELSNQKNMCLRLFFPKLRKVKSLPFKGTGKHKYSFQRIDVPSLPIHFCDCEEHNDPFKTTSQKHISPLNNVIQEEEVQIMNSVMAKLFEKENNERAAEEIKTVEHANISRTSYDDIELTGTATQATDDDNLVTNIGSGVSSNILTKIRGKPWLAVQDSRNNKLSKFKDRSISKRANCRKRKKVWPSNLSEITLDRVVEKVTGNDLAETSHANISIGSHSQEPDDSMKPSPTQVRTKQDMYTVEPKKSNFWLQKSSWKNLVGEGTNVSFSISNVLPGIDAMAPKVTRADDLDTTIPNDAAKKRKVQIEREKPKSAPSMPSIHLEKKASEPVRVVKSGKGDGNHTDRENGGCSQSQKESNAQPKRIIPKVGISEVCPFMRSAESEKEWATAKAALSGYIGKKNTEKGSSRSSKSMPFRKH